MSLLLRMKWQYFYFQYLPLPPVTDFRSTCTSFLSLQQYVSSGRGLYTRQAFFPLGKAKSG